MDFFLYIILVHHFDTPRILEFLVHYMEFHGVIVKSCCKDRYAAILKYLLSYPQDRRKGEMREIHAGAKKKSANI
jgi:hypothetical protein